MLGAPARSPSPFVAVVRRGEAFLFAALDACITDSTVQLVWDRRWGERRRENIGASFLNQQVDQNSPATNKTTLRSKCLAERADLNESFTGYGRWKQFA